MNARVIRSYNLEYETKCLLWRHILRFNAVSCEEFFKCVRDCLIVGIVLRIPAMPTSFQRTGSRIIEYLLGLRFERQVLVNGSRNKVVSAAGS